MTQSSTRRRFIQIVPLTGVALATGSAFATQPTPAKAAASAASAAAPAKKATAAAAPASATKATAAAPAAATVGMVNEKSPDAIALGYVSDATKADKVKYKTYVAGANCGSCALFQGKTGDASAMCPLFSGKGNVSEKGWCSAYAKRG